MGVSAGVSIRLHGYIPPTDAKLKLSAVKIKSAKPSERPYKLADGAGMYLLVHPTGSKYWRLKYRLAGKEKVLALGVYPEISLAEARIRRDDARLLIREGRDPGVAKQLQKNFLLNLGIKERFENLSKDKLPIEKRQLISDFERLISSSFMGQAFKVLIIRSENLSPFLGF